MPQTVTEYLHIHLLNLPSMGYNSTNIPPEVIASLPESLREQIPLYDETLQPNLYASAVICIILAFVAVFLRLYARRLKRQALGWDDYMIIVALVCQTDG